MRGERLGEREGWSEEGLYWRQVGQGADVLCIHGGPGSDHKSLWPGLKPLSEHFRLTLFDQQSCGKSEGSPFGWTLKSMARSTSRLSHELGLQRPVILGQSFGGFVAQELATTYAELAAAYVFSSTVARENEEAVAQAFTRIGGKKAGEAALDFCQEATEATWKSYKWQALPHYNTTVSTRKSAIRKDMLFYFWNGERRKMDYRRALRGVQEPNLTIVGSEDPITPTQLAREISDNTRGDWELIAGAGHGVWRDRPEEFFATAIPWIKAHTHNP